MSEARHRGEDRSARRPPRIALAEDDDELRGTLGDTLTEDGFEVSLLADGPSVIAHLEQARAVRRYPDLLVLDHRMPGVRGLEVLTRLRAAGSRVRTILITGCGAEVRRRARSLDAFAVLDKPIDLEVFLRAVHGGARARVPTRRQPSLAPGAPACAACGSTEHLRLGERAAGVHFCADCWSRAEPPGPYDDVGGPG